jgi:hypothetical protein
LRALSRALPLASAATFSAIVASASCSVADDGANPDDGGGVDSGRDTRVQVFDVREETEGKPDLCGNLESCDPDYATICTPIKDSGVTADADAADAPSLLACRVVRSDNKVMAACAPAGKAIEDELCSGDEVCGPGLACIGDEPGIGRCLRYCCKAALAPAAPDPAGTHYCTPKRLAGRTEDKVPVWVKLDNCTLLQDELQCPKNTACTVVTNDGKTTCVPRGTGREGARCEVEPCDQGYVCMGTTERRCRKICVLKTGAGCADAAVCQALPTMPTGFGICP